MERLMKGRTIFIIAHRSVTLILYNSFHKYVTNIFMNIFYVPEAYIMHFGAVDFLIVPSKGLYGWGGGGAGRLSSFMHLLPYFPK
jgi:hypothetical protein